MKATLLLAAVLLLVASTAEAAAPYGSLDVVQNDTGLTAGWATDPDKPSVDLMLEITIDGVLHKRLWANSYRADLAQLGICAGGTCAFGWIAPPVGAGDHIVRVYARGIGVNGLEDGEVVEIGGSPKPYAPGCTRLSDSPLVWCNDNPGYWVNRAASTTYLSNAYVRAGVNSSYGGALLELYGDDWNTNVVDEHGGSGVQLSFYGYGSAHKDANESYCHGGENMGPNSPRLHNPIQAIGREYGGGIWQCAWETTSNDATVLGFGPDWIEVQKINPYGFFMADFLSNLNWNIRTSLLDVGLKIEYMVKYTGENLGPARQEVPALFPAAGLTTYYFRTQGGQVHKVLTGGSCNGAPNCTVCQSGKQCVLLSPTPPPGCTQDPSLCSLSETVFQIVGTLQSGNPWVTACNSTDTQCLTTSIADLPFLAFVLNAGTNIAYMTPTGMFSLSPGLDLFWNVRLYPYKYDRMINGSTIEQRVIANPGHANGTPVSAAYSCLGGCSGFWTDTHTRDNSSATAWSSNYHSGSQTGGEWVAFWFNAWLPTNFITLVPRQFNNLNQCVPVSVTIYYSSGGTWLPLRTVDLPSDIPTDGLEVSLPQVTTNGLLVYSSQLRPDAYGGYYFQLAEAYAGLR